MLELLALLLALLILSGSICGIIALCQLQQYRQQLLSLQQQLARLQHALPTPQVAVNPVPVTSMTATPATTTTTASVRPVIATAPAATTSITTEVANGTTLLQNGLNWLEQQLIRHGMVWLGAVALALGGIFLVRHSLDAGWLSPLLRISLGAIFGLSLIAASEWLHQQQRQQQLHPTVPAALASGGFITLYASILTALQLYQLLPAGLAFVLLALTALAASWFSLRQGPLLAVIGIIGAYAVPALVSTGSANITGLLGYISLITLSSVIVERRVQRRWLWLLPMIGHSGWLLAALLLTNNSQLWAFWLVLGASFVLLVWLPRIGLYGQRRQLQHWPLRQWLPPLREHWLALGLLLLAVLAVILYNNTLSFTALLLLLVILAATAYSDSRSEWILWASAVLALGWLQLNPASHSGGQEVLLFSGSLLQQQLLLLLLTGLALLGSVTTPARLHWHSYLACLPVLLLGLSFTLAAEQIQHSIRPLWMVWAAILVILHSVLAKRATSPEQAFIYSAGANFALTFCFTLYLDAAALTLAIAAQLVLISVLALRQRQPVPQWLFKLLVVVLLLRFSCAPFIDSYANQTLFGLHWSFVLYPLTLLCFVLSWRLWRGTALQGWLEGASLQLVAVFITVQTQYWLQDGDSRFRQMDFLTLLVHGFNWLLLALVYQWRSYRAGSQAKLYRIAAAILLLLAGYIQLQLTLSTANPFISDIALGKLPLWNNLLLLWGLPALCCLGFARLAAPNVYRPAMYYIAAALAGLFILASIRHFWQGGSIGLQHSTSMAEHYSYSLILLLLAIATILLAQFRCWPQARKAGFILLSLVIVKVFFFDLGGLSGILRAASFIGLGLSLVMLSWLFQRLNRQTDTAG